MAGQALPVGNFVYEKSLEVATGNSPPGPFRGPRTRNFADATPRSRKNMRDDLGMRELRGRAWALRFVDRWLVCGKAA